MTGDVSAVIITGNEKDTIRDCLESVRWAREIIVLDSKSKDGTVDIARHYTDKVYVEEWKGYVDQKNAAMQYCSCRWILSLDADERVCEGLRREIEAALSRDDDDLPDGFYMPRRSFYLGRWIRYGGWYPDLKLRLARRDRARWVGQDVHERLFVPGRCEDFQNPILHYTYRDLSDHLAKIDGYTTIAARHKFKSGKKAHLANLVFHPLFKFLRMFVLKGGFLEGKAGLVLSTMGAYYVFLKYAKLWEYQQNNRVSGCPEVKE